MHKRPKNRRRGAILAVVGLTVLAARAAVVLYLAFYPPQADRTAASAQEPDGALRAASVRFGPEGDALRSDMSADEILAEARSVAQQARARGMNGLVLVVQTREGAVYRDWAVPALEQMTAGDTLFHPTDGLALWCQAAGEEGLSVYAAVDQSVYDPSDKWQSLALERLARKYPVAGVRVYRPAAEGSFFDTYEPLAESGEIVGVTRAAWSQPQALFLHAVEAARSGASFAGAAFAW